MKQQNFKQGRYSARKVAWAAAMTRNRFLFCLASLFVLVIIGFSLFHPDIIDLISAAGLSGSGLTLANMGFIGNLAEATDRYTAGNQIAYKVWLTEVSQIDETQTFPSPNNNREVGTVPLKNGEFMHYFEAIDNTLKDNSTGEKTELSTDVTNTFSLVMGGDGVKLYDFVEQYAGGRFIIIYQQISTGDYSILGSLTKPMILQGMDRKRDNEATAVTFNFQNKTFQQPLKYVGAIINTTPQTVAAGTTELAIVAGKSQYQLTDHTSQVVVATISGITPDMYGKTIEVLGSGGDFPPMIEDNNVYILVDGVSCTGISGFKIIFRIHDDNTLIEIPNPSILPGFGRGTIYGPELHTYANAVSDPNGNEANATTGWVSIGLNGTGANVFEPQSLIVYNGLYAFKISSNDTPTVGACIYWIPSLIVGEEYLLRFYIRHLADFTGAWRCWVDSGGGLISIKDVATSIDDFELVEYSFIPTVTECEIRIGEANGDNNGGVYADALSLKKKL